MTNRRLENDAANASLNRSLDVTGIGGLPAGRTDQHGDD